MNDVPAPRAAPPDGRGPSARTRRIVNLTMAVVVLLAGYVLWSYPTYEIVSWYQL